MKKFYNDNRVFVILMGIVIICVAIMLFLLGKYVVSSNTGDKYGNRLDGIEDVIIEEKQKEDIASALKENESVTSAKVIVHGKIINFVIKFVKDTKIDEMQSIAIKSLDSFEEEYKNYYDMQFLLEREVDEVEESEDEEVEEEISAIIGYIKAGATTISWSNNAK